jgi:glyoxylase-like metal-dependent hydrolase (beta-lactamase superfamily II)
MFKLGPASVTRIVDFDPFILPFDFLLPGCDLNELSGEATLLSPDHVDFEAGTILLSLHSFVLRTGNLTVLIDTCVGEHKPRPRRPDWHERHDTGYLSRLAAAGLSPADIDIVMCTHLHADHVGWNTRLEDGRWVPTFPNARYVVGRTEFEHCRETEEREPGKHNHGSFADSVLPVVQAGLVEPVDDGFELAMGLEIVPLRGHSPGQIGLELNCGAKGRALFCGDAFHSPVQIFRPHWSSAFCHDPELAGNLRRDLAERSAGDGTILLPAHLRGSHGMRVEVKGDAGFRPILV